jgi:hypothetical protein
MQTGPHTSIPMRNETVEIETRRTNALSSDFLCLTIYFILSRGVCAHVSYAVINLVQNPEPPPK